MPLPSISLTHACVAAGISARSCELSTTESSVQISIMYFIVASIAHRVPIPLTQPRRTPPHTMDTRKLGAWPRTGQLAGATSAGSLAGSLSNASATAALLKTRQVVTDTTTATTKATQYGAVIPNLAANPPASSAPRQLPPAAMNRLVLLTRPSIAGGVSRCRSELFTIIHNAP